MKTLAIIGACGHGKVLADIAIKIGYENIVYFDDNKKEYEGHLIVGGSSDIETYGFDTAIAIGNAGTRKKLLEDLERKGITIPTLIHPHAVIASGVTIGIGSVVMPGVVLQPGSVIGKGCIINTCSSVDHDSMVSDYVHIAVGAHVAGNVNIGTKTWIGAGAVIKDNIHICADCMVGAGAVVVENIEKSGVFVGIPARHMKKKLLTT